MRTFLMSLMVVLVSFTFTAEYADAKRFGGGSSFGKTFSTPKKTAQPAPVQQKSATNTAGKTAQQPAKKRSGFGGLMAGLLAGGLLGALFFGGAFEGVQLMDILLIVGVLFLIFKIFTMYRQSQKPPQYATDGAQYEMRPERQQRSAFEPAPKEEVKPTPAFSSSGVASEEPELPAWFNKQAFLDGAREHFITLQRAWDASDWTEIATYTSEELLEALKGERAKSPADQTTEVVSVMAEMANFITEENHVVVSINFYGWLKEDSDQTTEFNEIWHLTRDTTADNADWIIVGIEQP